MKLIFLDTETTGLTEDPTARLCQVAYKVDDRVVNELFKPPVEIGLGAMAVHHITQEMVNDKPSFMGSDTHAELKSLLSKKSNVLVAHNAQFDIEMLRREGIDTKAFICSLTVARTLLEGQKLKGFSLQVLRYHFNLEMADSRAHDAQGDIEVLEAVFNRLLDIADEKGQAWAKRKNKKWSKKDTLERMQEITNAPVSPDTVITFGKHQGTKLKDLVAQEPSYCQWLVTNAKNPTDKVITTLRHMLNARK